MNARTPQTGLDLLLHDLQNDVAESDSGRNLVMLANIIIANYQLIQRVPNKKGFDIEDAGVAFVGRV